MSAGQMDYNSPRASLSSRWSSARTCSHSFSSPLATPSRIVRLTASASASSSLVSINDSEINGLVDDLLFLQHNFQETGNPITDERRELWLKEQVAKRTQEPFKTNILTQLAAKRLGWSVSDEATAENSSVDQFIQELTDLMKTMNLDGRMAILHHARELARIPDYQKSIP